MLKTHLATLRNFVLFIALSFYGSDLTAQTTRPAVATAELTFSHDILDFGAVTPGESAHRTLTVTHTGNSESPEITILAAVLDELDSSRYANDFRSTVTLQPREFFKIDVVFKPQQSGSAPGTLVITTTTENPVTRVELTGIGVGNNPSLVRVDSGAERCRIL